MNSFTHRQILQVSLLALIAFSCQTKKTEQTELDDKEVDLKLESFGLQAANIFLYYQDLDSATTFYTDILGMEIVADYQMAKILRVAEQSYITLVDAEAGMHSAEEPKTVAIALITDQLEEWYAHLIGLNIPVKYELKTKDGSAHDGFVITDPEGYLLEFERFNIHEENTNFIPYLNKISTIYNSSETVPENLGFKATVAWLYYHDILELQEFYESKMGLEFVADQGWTKILRITNSSYLGLVDQSRGMHKYTEDKAVNVSFILEDLEGWFKHVKNKNLFELKSDSIISGPDNSYQEFIGYDPGKYFLEFDHFNPHRINTKLLEYLKPK